MYYNGGFDGDRPSVRKSDSLLLLLRIIYRDYSVIRYDDKWFDDSDTFVVNAGCTAENDKILNFTANSLRTKLVSLLVILQSRNFHFMFATIFRSNH